MSQQKILVIGSINMDFSVVSQHIPEIGETILGYGFKNHPGGKGANQAVAVARLGGHCTFLGRVGNDDYCDVLRKRMAEEGIHCQDTLMKCQDDTRTGIAMIFVDEIGRNSIVVASGANFKLSVQDIRDHEELISESDIIVLQLESPVDTVCEAIRIAKKHGKRVILDPAPAPEPSAVQDELFNVHILSPNESEAEILTGIGDGDNCDEKRSQKLLEKGTENIVLKLGENGCMHSTSGGEGNKVTNAHYKAAKLKKEDVVDTTAAGDAFTGALAVGLAMGMTIGDACAFANKAGAVACTKRGSLDSMPYISEVEKLQE